MEKLLLKSQKTLARQKIPSTKQQVILKNILMYSIIFLKYCLNDFLEAVKVEDAEENVVKGKKNAKYDCNNFNHHLEA